MMSSITYYTLEDSITHHHVAALPLLLLLLLLLITTFRHYQYAAMSSWRYLFALHCLHCIRIVLKNVITYYQIWSARLICLTIMANCMVSCSSVVIDHRREQDICHLRHHGDDIIISTCCFLPPSSLGAAVSSMPSSHAKQGSKFFICGQSIAFQHDNM